MQQPQKVHIQKYTAKDGWQRVQGALFASLAPHLITVEYLLELRRGLFSWLDSIEAALAKKQQEEYFKGVKI